MANKNNDDFMATLAIKKIAPYLYEVNYSDWDYSIGADDYEKYHNMNGSCSVVRNGNYVGRNFDWYYSEDAYFIINCKATKDRHSSIGVAGNISLLTDEVAGSGVYNPAYRYLPFHTLDGVNDCGVFANINVVPTGDYGLTTGTNDDGEDLCSLMLVRYVLDYADSASNAIELIEKLNIYSPISDLLTQEVHWMIADEKDTFVVELIDNKVVIVDSFVSDKKIATNFYLSGFDGNTSTAYYNSEDYDAETTTLTPHAMGLERYDIIANGYADTDTKRGMIDTMKSVRYTKMYDITQNPYWYSEHSGTYHEFGDLTIDSQQSDFADIVEYSIEEYEHRTRNARTTWQTVHTSVYDLESRKLWIMPQEQDDEYSFEIVKGYESEKLGTLYTVLYDSVLSKIKDYDFLNLSQEDVYSILSDYIRPAVASFRICKVDLSNRDEVGFNVALNDTEIEILSNYMVIEYLDSNYIRVPLALKQSLSSKDFNAFSPANQLSKMMEMRNRFMYDNETLLSRYAWIKRNY